MRSLLQSLLGSALLWAAFPPLDFWPLAWIAPIPWVLLICRKELVGRRPYLMIGIAGFCFWMAVLHWLRLPHWATSFGWIGMSLCFSVYLPLFVGLSRVAVHRFRVPVILAAPVVWAGLELVRAHFLTGFSMGNLGHTQYRWIGLIQVSDLAGDYGVGFVVLFVAASLARMISGGQTFLSVGRTQTFLSASSGYKRQTGMSVLLSPIRQTGMSVLLSPIRQTGMSVLLAFLSAVAMLAAVLGYGHLRMADNPTKAGPKIALIQGSIDVEMRHDPDRRDRIFKEYYAISKEAVEKHRDLDLIVWPESMFVEPLISFDADAVRPAEFDGTDAEFRDRLEHIRQQFEAKKSTMAWTAQTLGVPLLLGVDAAHYSADGMRLSNSAAYVAADGGLLGRYDKMHLVMFGEYVPFASHFPWLQRLTPLPTSAVPGSRPAAFEVKSASCGAGVPPAKRDIADVTPAFSLGGRDAGTTKESRRDACTTIAPNICYESVLSHVIRGQVQALAAEGGEPDILVNLTNDGWFWGSSELDMHLACGVFRAVECRKPFLIAANTGFSAWIDSDGRIHQKGRRRATDTIIAEPRLDTARRSWYLAHGDWFAGICLLACVVLVIPSCCRVCWR